MRWWRRRRPELAPRGPGPPAHWTAADGPWIEEIPVISGVAYPGGVLTVRARWRFADTVSYQWTSFGRPIANAVGRTYEPRLVDRGHDVRVVVTAQGADRTVTAASSAVWIR